MSIASGLEEGATVVSYSGYNKPPGIVSVTSTLVITFETDNSGSAEGFSFLVVDIDSTAADGKITNWAGFQFWILKEHEEGHSHNLKAYPVL